MFKVAVDDRHLAKGMNPAADMVKPKRSDRRRMALEDEHFEQMVELIGSTGDDPQLDALVLKFIDITGARREGLLDLQVGGIDREECTVRLHEKFDTVFDQPVPDMFVDELLTFAAARRSAARTDSVFVKRTASGGFTPMGRRRYDYIFTDRLQSSFTWADKLQVTAHTLRHHAIIRVERRYGRAVAQAFARHARLRTLTPEETIVEVSRKDSPTGQRMIVKPYPKDDEPRTLKVSQDLLDEFYAMTTTGYWKSLVPSIWRPPRG